MLESYLLEIVFLFLVGILVSVIYPFLKLHFLNPITIDKTLKYLSEEKDVNSIDVDNKSRVFFFEERTSSTKLGWILQLCIDDEPTGELFLDTTIEPRSIEDFPTLNISTYKKVNRRLIALTLNRYIEKISPLKKGSRGHI